VVQLIFAVDTVTLHNFTLALQFLLQIADQGSSVARRLILVPEALNNHTEMSRLEKLIVSQLIKHIYIFFIIRFLRARHGTLF
jgi:hypothetical protein